MIKITEFEDMYSKQYENFVSSFDDSILYYSLKYKLFLEDLLNCKSRYLLALEKNKIIGILPLMEAEGKLGKIINSLPFYGSNGSVLSNRDDATDALYNYLNSIADNKNVSAITLVTHPFFQTQTPPIQSNFIDERIGQWTSLKPSSDDLMQILDSSTRRNIRKAQKSNITIKIDNNAWKFLEKTHSDNMNAIKGNAKSNNFFTKAQKHFKAGEDYNIYIAELDNQPIAAILLFYYNKTVEYYTPTTIKSARNLQPTALIIYTAMLEAANKGYTWWNWGGTWKTQEGVYRFKKKWGAQDFSYKYFTLVNNKDILKQSSSTLLKEYPDFYVVPFDKLEE